ncbi:CLP1-like protein [Micractinium conductrix]|uniref:Protein CLP1 homolog n=1 Tax=Micractinium conductrix TaxID=554055 RepID=A0A2P6VM17_9CHLO|nr:CLP1-like protein [Micractinium conductrix]|eukprot:PSC75129.1 CLP1-like protein [Micractinium conductrix]
MDGSGGGTQQLRLEPQHELRMEVDWGKTVHVQLVEGEAEVFGTSLDLGERLTIGGQKLALFSWQGCTLQLQGEPDLMYTSDETPMGQYASIHDVLDARRQEALKGKAEGPRTFVVGPTDVGKSSLCKILLNYAVRGGWAPTFVDLDIGQGSITVPGCVAATPVEAPIDVEDGVPTDTPLVYYSGTPTPSDNPALYKHLVERLANVLDARAQSDPQVRASGMVLNSMGWVVELGYELLKHAVETLKCNVVLVVGDERLYSQLAADLRRSSPNKQVLKLPRSGGVVVRSRELRAAARKVRVEEYFYGYRKELSPASQTTRFDELQVFRVGSGPRAPSSALPIGATSVSDPLKLSRVTNPQELLYTLLAVSHAPQPELLLSVNVAGFIYVQDVDLAKGTITYLAPCAGALPGQLLLAGAFKAYLD